VVFEEHIHIMIEFCYSFCSNWLSLLVLLVYITMCVCHCCTAWSLHFMWVVYDTKCIVVTRVCVSVRGRMPTLAWTRDVTWRTGRGCPLVVHYWAICNRCMGCIAMATQCKREMLASTCLYSLYA